MHFWKVETRGGETWQPLEPGLRKGFVYCFGVGSNPSALPFLGVLNLRKVQTKDTSIIALKMEKSGLRTAAKPLGSPIFLENALFLLKKYVIAAFVVVDKSGYFYA